MIDSKHKMCGIIAVFNNSLPVDFLKETLLKLTVLLRHRGPDWSNITISSDGKFGFAHERLSIVDPEGESQPFVNQDNILAVNGEIYNHKILEKLVGEYDYSTKSDCEVIIPLSLYSEDNFEKWLSGLDGQFAFALLKRESDGEKSFIAARDPIGIAPLYFTKRDDGSIWYASEMKVLVELNEIYKNLGELNEIFYKFRYERVSDPEYDNTIKVFKPGHFALDNYVYEPYVSLSKSWQFEEKKETDLSNIKYNIKSLLEKSVKKRLMTDVPFGVLLSGGLDSSIIASIVCKHSKYRVETDGKEEAYWPKIHTFSIGVKGYDSPDLKYAREVSKYLGTVHHEFRFSVEDGINALPEVIRHIETYDTTTVRASTPMFLLSRKIKAMGIKVLLGGEGSDELFAGYLYFHKAPNAKELQEEIIKKVERLHMYDCLRANKASMAWGVETRVPFLDTEFVDYVMRIDPELKMIKDGKMEKQILREAFDWGLLSGSYLPSDVLWRQKEQFSDGVGYSWIDGLKEYAGEKITDLEMENVKEKYPLNTPRTKEELMYRNIFVGIFGQECEVEKTVPWESSIACSTSKAVEWDEKWKNQADPSGRIKDVHLSSM